MRQDDTEGCVNLVVRIIEQSIIDACSYKRPRNLTALRSSARKRYWFLTDDQYRTMRRKRKIRSKISVKNRYCDYVKNKINEILSHEARMFLSLENEMFNQYCNLIAADPLFIHEVIWKKINDFDNK
jgi:hypothetical protein